MRQRDQEILVTGGQVRGRPGGWANSVDPVWSRLREEASDIVRREPALASFVIEIILNHDALEEAVIHRVASRLGHGDVSDEMIRQAFADGLRADPGIADAMRNDIVATYDRDPACHRFIEPVLYFKGFQAVQTQRFAHALWHAGRRDFAYYLQSRASQVFQVDVHPAVPLGRGIFLDHATSVVIGETAVIEDDVSILHEVTLGGTGKAGGDRHPKIRRGVLIGAGAKILGNIEIGACSRVAAGSVVLKSVPPNSTVVGVPARVVGTSDCPEPARSMDQIIADSDN